MTPEEIRTAVEDSKTMQGWLKELCYQVALSNELAVAREIKAATSPFLPPVPVQPIIQEPRQKRKYVRKQTA